jgi:hypothetical protein
MIQAWNETFPESDMFNSKQGRPIRKAKGRLTKKKGEKEWADTYCKCQEAHWVISICIVENQLSYNGQE